jgi:hypothetical protein
MNKRPLSVTVIACVYIATGVGGFAFHIADLRMAHRFQYDALWIELVRLAAVFAGVFMLLSRNWARWPAVAWMAFHVVVGARHGLVPFAIHCLFLAVLAWLLFRPPAARYFRRTDANP